MGVTVRISEAIHPLNATALKRNAKRNALSANLLVITLILVLILNLGLSSVTGHLNRPRGLNQLLPFLRERGALLLVLLQLLLATTLSFIGIISNKLRKHSKMRSSHKKIVILKLAF